MSQKVLRNIGEWKTLQWLKLNLTVSGFKGNTLFNLIRRIGRSTMYSYLPMKMGVRQRHNKF